MSIELSNKHHCHHKTILQSNH